ncbi:MAG: integrase family protein [Proteobacteria bacterium]|nr:integrase family protein [Pseudomonadota bacterium]
MPEKLPKRGKNKLPSRKNLPIRGKKAKSKSRKLATRLKFTKTALAKIDHPEKGQREIYRDTENRHLALRITQTAKTFYWEKTIGGSQKKVTIGRFPDINVEQARVKAADISADYTKGIDVQAFRKSMRQEETFGALWEDFRENRPRRNKSRPYSKTLDDQWDRVLKRWETKKLSDLSYSTVEKMIMKMRKRAPVYANRVQRHGQAMYNYARRNRKWAYRGDNPFEFDYESEEGNERTMRLESKDMPAFMEGLAACSEAMRLLFLTSLYTGRRIGEVQSMRWNAMNLDVGSWEITVYKGGKVRHQKAVLPAKIIESLSKRKAKSDSEWVFPSASKSGHVQEIKKAWATVRKASGLRELQARDLRRTLASWAQEVNVPMAVVQAQLGHSSITTTAKHYTSIDIDIQRAALEKTVASMITAAANSLS